MWLYLWAFYFVPLIFISVFVPVPYCLDDCGFVVEPEVRQVDSSSSIVFFSRLLWLFEVFCISIQIVKLFVSAAAAKSLQSCTTLCDPIDVSQPGSPAPRILQARTMEWVAISFSNA